MIVDNAFRIGIDIPLDDCLLVGKELRVLLQPLVDLAPFLAPISVFVGVLTVGKHDCRDVVILQEPVGLHEYVVTILEAKRLVVPTHGVRWHKARLKLFRAPLNLVLVPHFLLSTTGQRIQLVAEELDIGVVEDVKRLFVVLLVLYSGQTEGEVHTIVVAAEREVD